MKDTTITASRKRNELYILLACFILANGLNVFSIIKFNTGWKELYSSLWYVCLVCFALYGIFGVLRLIWRGLNKLFRRKS